MNERAAQPDVRITVALPGGEPVDVTLSYPLSKDQETLLQQLREVGNLKGVIECRMHDDDYRLADLRDSTGRVRGAWLYLRSHGDRLLLCHWPYGGITGSHAVPSLMTAEHKAGREYIALRGESNGYQVQLEKSLATRTVTDVVVRGSHTMAAEVQVSGAGTGNVMHRTNAATAAGAVSTWFTTWRETPWMWKAPTVLANDIAGLAPNTWTVASGPRVLEWEKCEPWSRFDKCPDGRRSFCGQWHALWQPMHGLTVDDIVEKVPGGGLVRVDTRTKQGTMLTTPECKKAWDEHVGSSSTRAPVRRVQPGLNHSDYSASKLRERIATAPASDPPTPSPSVQVPPVPHRKPVPADTALYSSRARFGINGRVQRFADEDGHLWPITGCDCKGCGHPVMPCYPNQAYHPECDPNPQGWTDSQIAQWTPTAAPAPAPPPTPAPVRDLAEEGRQISERLLRKGLPR